MSAAVTNSCSSSTLRRLQCSRCVLRDNNNRRQLVASSVRRLKKSAAVSTSISSSFEGDNTIVVIGGTGRVGSSAANAIQKALSESSPSSKIVLASRNKASFEETVSRFPGLRSNTTTFREVDVSDIQSIENVIKGADLVINTAGPFQTVKTCNVLEACINLSVPNYLDVCDDGSYAKNAKSLDAKAKASKVTAITSGGIYPGVSNIMAAKAIQNQLSDAKIARERNDQDGEAESSSSSGEKKDEIEYLLYNYFTAGSGGVGSTILATSFLLCGEEVTIYENGKEVRTEPASSRKVVDFGKGVGKREIFLYNLPEVESTHKIFNVPTVKARFGTSPGIWNTAMVAMARLLPSDILENKELMQQGASALMPLVKLVDSAVGEKMSIKIDCKLKDGKISTSLFTHNKLSECVGQSVAAFALAMLEGQSSYGVWYPEETETFLDQDLLLERASEGATQFQLSQAPWKLESQPINLGFGISFE